MSVRGADRGYARLCAAIAGARLPVALVDLDAVDTNAERLLALANAGGKRLRLATKSLRAVALVRHLLARGGQGLMTFTAAETRHLCEAHGLDDAVLAYPTLASADLDDLAGLAKLGKTASVVVDSAAHVDAASARARAHGAIVPLVVEVDLAFRPLGGAARIGALRSPIADVASAVALARRIAETPGVRFEGVMGYEAHVAGLPDRGPHRRWQNPIKRAIKLAARGPIEATRAELVRALHGAGLPPRIVNGGGSGNLAWCAREPALTEVTAGSGFLDSHLFDGYRDLELEPALFFALQVVRAPRPGVVTALGGGYVASGEAGVDRLPIPWAPPGLSLIGVEGAGEVQTPLTLTDPRALAPGDPVFFRPAKTGELAERFTEYLLVRGDRVVERAPTYRGEGRAFL